MAAVQSYSISTKT